MQFLVLKVTDPQGEEGLHPMEECPESQGARVRDAVSYKTFKPPTHSATLTVSWATHPAHKGESLASDPRSPFHLGVWDKLFCLSRLSVLIYEWG